MLEVSHKFITKPGQLPLPFNQDDGIGLARPGEDLYVHDCIIDLYNVPLDEQDGCFDITYGTSARIERCVLCNTGKLSLLGSGDAGHRKDEEHALVQFTDCILENFGRRGPEVQCGMICTMERCIICNWGAPNMFSVRSFGAWAHDGGRITAIDCAFININRLSLRQRLLDRAHHFTQALFDNGLKGLFLPRTYTAGWRRGLTASDTGVVTAVHCYAGSKIIVEGRKGEPMTHEEAVELYFNLERMKKGLYGA